MRKPETEHNTKIPLPPRPDHDTFQAAVLVVAAELAHDHVTAIEETRKAFATSDEQASFCDGPQSLVDFLWTDEDGNPKDVDGMDAVQCAAYTMVCRHYGFEPHEDLAYPPTKPVNPLHAGL